MVANESDTTMAKVRLRGTIPLAEHVEKINGLKMDTRETGALWLI